ncbi:branched-chain amino acid ABC transporter substrate-binding protein [Nakamurella endophytica]|uniref:Branched-chain amino acid ABC transporter substrate-binding protein n=1 Tax=Nakamurella endophytica TaxID=1748367 RepID=A0A917SS32_9ACTN|nr:branched-chain amino acid ABC transporter substrate-binding protein [Nakamurella endophytica]
MVAALALLIGACGSGGDSAGGSAEVGVSADTIRLAASQTLSGPGAASCAPSTDAAKLWFDKVNTDGGIAGRKIDFEVLDDGYDPARALANVRTFEKDKFAMVGACGSATAAAIYKTLSQKGIPFLFPTNGVSEVVKPASPGIFQVLPLYEDQTASMVRYGFEKSGKGSIFVVVNPLGAYQSAIDSAKKQATDLGGTFTNSAVATLGTTDYTPIALQIKQAKPDYVVMSMGGSDSAKFVNALVDQNAVPAKAILGTTASVAGSFLSSYNPGAASKIFFGSAIQLPAGKDADCTKLLAGTPAVDDPIALTGCASARAITTAITETKDLTRANLMKTIEGWQKKEVAPGILAELSFSSTDHIGISSLFIVQPQGRAFRTIATCPYGEDVQSQGACTAAA